MGEEERTEGNMPVAEGQNPPEAKGKTPEDVSKVSPEDELRYSQKQLEAFKQTFKSDAGRDRVTVVAERDTLKAQLLSKGNEIEDIQADRETLQQQIKDLSSDDPAKFDLVTRERELKGTERKLKAERLALDTDRLALEEEYKPDRETRFEITVWNIASEFTDGDPAMLKDLCGILEVKSDEQIRKAAETIWSRKEPGDETLNPYSGVTSGGGDNLGSLSPKDRLREVQRRLEQ